jgi:hypothetical protein
VVLRELQRTVRVLEFPPELWLLSGESDFTLECLGAASGPRFLDGNTGAGTVALAPSTDEPFTGTRWRVGVPLAEPELTPADE